MITTFGSKVSAPGDGDRLLLAAGEGANRPVDRRKACAQPVDHRLGIALHRRAVDETHAHDAARRFAAEEDVGGDILLTGEREVLVDHLDAHAAALAGRQIEDRLAVEADTAGIRSVHAGDDLHQRRFAGAVVADQPDDFAATHRKIDAMQDVHGAEALGDAIDFENTHTRLSFLTCHWSMKTARISTLPIAICW